MNRISLALSGAVLWGLVALSAQGKPTTPTPQVSAAPGVETEFTESFERDYILRSPGHIQVTNMRGDVTVIGWPLDKIRVRAVRRARATHADEGRRLFSAVDLRFKAESGLIELSAEFGQGLSLQERLREREDPHTGMSMVVYAPMNSKLSLWGVRGAISVKKWNSSVDLRSASGSVLLESIAHGSVSVLCPDCAIRMNGIRGSVRCMGENGSIDLSDIEASNTYVESAQGAVRVSKIQGEQLYVIKEGSLKARDLRGRIEFHAQSGSVDIDESEGFLSGRSTSGSITAKMRDWEFADKAVIESLSGDIQLGLPDSFAGEVDLQAPAGKIDVGFTVIKTQNGVEQQAASTNGRILGRIGDGGELLKVSSARGNIKIFRKR
jgi:DUF4097 and DUF4098 domain-containing protein YvlB